MFSEENLKFNRFRTLADISIEKGNRTGPPKLDIESQEIKDILQLDLHANNYRDGVWGSIRHIVVKDGTIDDFCLFFMLSYSYVLKMYAFNFQMISIITKKLSTLSSTHWSAGTCQV